MKFLLDTNAVIAILKADATFIKKLMQYQTDDFGIPTIVAHELFYGAYRSQRVAENLSRIEAMQFLTLNFVPEDARCSGEVRAALSKSGNPIGPYDVLIAGQALSRDLTVITHNTKEFFRVPKLRVEDWEL